MDWAIKQNLLDGFFVRQKAEAHGMILEEFNREIYEKNAREDGYLEGIEQSAQQKAVEAAITAIKKYKASPEDAAKDMNAPLELVLEALKKQESVDSLFARSGSDAVILFGLLWKLIHSVASKPR